MPAEHRTAVAAMAAVHLDGLVTLRIADYPVDVALAGALARLNPLPRLRSLALPLTFLNATVIAVLRAGLRPTYLNSLDLGENGLGDDGAVLLADRPVLATVTFLNLFDEGIGSAGLRPWPTCRTGADSSTSTSRATSGWGPRLDGGWLGRGLWPP